MTNFLTEPYGNVIANMANAASTRAETDRKTQAFNALSKVYGPEAGDPAALAAVTDARKAQSAETQQQALHMLGILDAVAQSDGDVGAVFDQMAPSLPALGVDEAHIPQFRQMLVTQPRETIQRLYQAFQPPAAGGVTGAPVYVQNPDGTYSAVLHDKRGNAVPMDLGSGQPVVPVQGAARVAQGDARLLQGDTRLDIGQQNADTARGRLGVAQQNADTGTYRAGVTSNNSQYGAPAGVNLPAQGSLAGAVEHVESRGDPNAVSPAGARGTMQTMPGTLRDPGFGVQPARNDSPQEQTRVGRDYLAALAQHYGNPTTALIAYNWGPGNADAWLAAGADYNKLPRETREYIGKVAVAQAVGAPLPAAPRRASPSAAPASPSAAPASTVAAPPVAAATRPAPVAPAAAAQPATGLPPTMSGKGRAMAISTAQHVAQNGDLLNNADQIIGSVVKQVGPFSAGAGSVVDLPGTVARNLQANLRTLQALGLNQWLASLKNQAGQTGIGRILQSEVANAQALYGNLEKDQSPRQLLYHLQLFQKSVHGIQTRMEQAFHAQYGVSPVEALGAGQPAAAPAAAAAPRGAVDYRTYFTGGH